MNDKKLVPAIRFRGFTDAWGQRPLSEITDIQKGQQLGKKEMIPGGVYPVLNGGQSPSGYTNRWNREPWTISICEGGSCGYATLCEQNFWSGGHNYTLHGPKVDTFFLFALLKARETELSRLRVGSALTNIQQKDLSAFLVALACHEEARRVGELFRAFDRVIALRQRELDKLKELKKSLLERMFPSEG